jgi:hypothetical protein
MAAMLKFQNKLNRDVLLYDSFSGDGADQNYYGTLTMLGTVKAETEGQFAPIHTPASVVIVFGTDQRPVGRFISLDGNSSFSIDDKNVAAMTDSGKFIDFITANPSSPAATTFHDLIGKSVVKDINDFFSANKDYADCTLATYMLAVTDKAKNPPAPNQPPQKIGDETYRLSVLCQGLGGKWPPGMPDVELRKFACTTSNNELVITGQIKLSSIDFGDEIISSRVLSLVPADEVKTKFYFNYAIGLNLFGTRIQFLPDEFNIPVGDGENIKIPNPTVTIDINPLFKFCVFKAASTIPFHIFGQDFDAEIDMVIDNIEAEINAVIKGDHSSLPSPSPMKGVHFNEFGVGMGIMFEPPAYALGIEGKFHIGGGDQRITLNNDTFALVCKMDGDIPNPVYISFYVEEMDFSTLIETFTDKKIALDFPVGYKDLSFQWSENPMAPVTLPDGSLSDMAFGCSGYVHLFNLGFYGSIKIDTNGIDGLLTMSPLRMGKLLQITGDGKGVSLKVDKDGNPINNTKLPATVEARKFIADAPSKSFIEPGGPEMTINSSASPYFSMNAAVSLLGANAKVTGTADKSGIRFELDYGAVITGKMECILQDYHNFSSNFQYGLDMDIPLPSIAGFSLGHIPLEASAGAGLAITTSGSNVGISIKADFNFEGLHLSVGPFELDVNISSLTNVLKNLCDYIIQHAEDIFRDIIRDAARWATFVKDQIIKGVTEVAEGLKTAFGKPIAEVASIMSSAGYALSDAASQIKNAFSASAEAVAGALKEGFNESVDGVASAMRTVGYGATELASAVQSAFSIAPDVVNTVLQGAGYTVDEIHGAFDSLGGDFKSFAEDTWHEAEKVFNPSNW